MTDSTSNSTNGAAALPRRTRQIVLAQRPHGEPKPEDFRLEEVDLLDADHLQDGQIIVANTVMSVDPYMRGRMDDTESYVPPFQIDQPLDGGAVGTVVASRSDAHPVGSSVVHALGWREHAVLDGAQARVVDTDRFDAGTYLGVLGMPGLTAYAGLLAVGEMKEGDAVFVSGAAGAVGSLVGQIAKLKGASRVVGSAGSAQKIARLRELGFDAAFDYHDGNVAEQLRTAAPDGIDVYFDNVGGDHLEAALSSLHVEGRVAMCGAIAQYNATEPPAAPRNLALAIGKRLTLRGFIVSAYQERCGADFQAEMGQWVSEGKVQWDETHRDGLDAAPQAFIDMLGGANLGKMLVRL